MVEIDDGCRDDAGGFQEEGASTLAVQAFSSLCFSCVGLLLAGWLLNVVQYWPVFVEIPQFFALVPVLLNLKGNLELTLSARLSTAANTGLFARQNLRRQTIVGNMVVIQVQAVAVGAIAGCHTLLLDVISGSSFVIEDAVFVVSSSVASTATASFVLGAIMCGLVYACYCLRLNPDNIAAPVAAALGDLSALYLLGVIGGRLYENDRLVGATIMLIVFLVLLPAAFWYAWTNPFVQPVLVHGWAPLLLAMVIASGAGLLFEASVQGYLGVAVIAPIINGLGGSVAAIYSSRRSTALHAKAKDNYFAAAATLFGLQAAVLLVVVYALGYLRILSIGWPMLVAILVVGQAQVLILMPMAHLLVKYLWSQGMEPDDYALPIITALGDVVGTGLLTAA